MCEPEFQQAVDTALGSSCCYPGLQALSTAHRRHCVPQNSQALHGSVPLDRCLSTQQPTAPRWDYLIGYGGARCLFCLEVHDASDVDKVLRKKRRLDAWLNGQGKPLKDWARGGVRYVLLPTGHVPGKRSRDMRRYAQAGIKVTRTLRLACPE